MDFRTLLAVNTLIVMLSGVALTLNFVSSRRKVSSVWMPLSCITAAAGMVLMAMRGRIDDVYSIGFANPLIVLSLAFLYRGYSILVKSRGKYWWLLVAVAMAAGSGVLWFRYVERNIAHRIGIMNFALAIGSLACLKVLTAAKDTAVHRAARTSAVCLGLYFILNLAHGLWIWNVALPDSLFASGMMQPWFMPVNMLLVTGIGIGHIWITGARQRLELESYAFTDELTGVLNRRALELKADEEISRSRRHGRPLAVMMCDMDNFKTANDARGHKYGDAVLRAVTTVLQSVLRQEDAIARIGGDEFVILLPETSRAVAILVAERLRAAIEHLQVLDPRHLDSRHKDPQQKEHGHLPHIQQHASFGLAMLDSVPGDTRTTLLARADAALYAAKHSGGNHIAVDDSPVSRTSTAPRSRQTAPSSPTIH
jgi:diguanylate cyclase (GGDEF)-like protein